jgi:hypothetical protein
MLVPGGWDPLHLAGLILAYIAGHDEPAYICAPLIGEEWPHMEKS